MHINISYQHFIGQCLSLKQCFSTCGSQPTGGGPQRSFRVGYTVVGKYMLQ